MAGTASTNSLRFAAFDLDGTLIDSAGSIVDGVLACWSACGFPDLDPEKVRRIIGLPWEAGVRLLLPGAGETEFNMIRNYHAEVRDGRRTRPPVRENAFDGALEILDVLEERGYLLGLVTSRSGGRLRELLEKHQLEDRFLTHKTADMGPGKPNPHLLIEAMNDLGVERRNTAMIGDTTFDIQMAENAGAASVGVSWGVHEVAELRAAGARHVVDGFHELPPILDALTAG
jgi:phosphoglycolate phosphatase